MPDETIERVEFNIDSVTVDEAELLEETLGIPWADCIGTKSGMAKVMRGFVWLHKRRSDPDLKLDDVKFNIQRFGLELGFREEGEDESDPLEASEPSETSSTSSSTRSSESHPGTRNGSRSSSSSDAASASSP